MFLLKLYYWQEEHDIALLDLGSRVEFTTPVRPICLGEETDEKVGTATTIVGWGSTSIG